MVSSGSGAPLRVPVAELDRLWTREAVFLWKNFDALAPDRDPARTASWARVSLTRLGYAPDSTSLSDSISRFQRDAELAADGVIGARTLMALYSLGPYTRPRLGGAS